MFVTSQSYRYSNCSTFTGTADVYIQNYIPNYIVPMCLMYNFVRVRASLSTFICNFFGCFSCSTRACIFLLYSKFFSLHVHKF